MEKKIETINFSALLLYVDDELAKNDFFVPLKDTKREIVEISSVPYEVFPEFDEENKFFWLDSTSGTALPCGENVYNLKTKSLEKNSRDTSHVEMREQNFALYDFYKKILYIKNRKFANVLIYYLKLKTGIDNIKFKKMLKNIDDFYDKITTINSIKLASTNELFSDRGLFEYSANAFGLGEPNQYTFEIKFNRARKTEMFKDKLKELINKRKGGEIDSIICAGEDDSAMECVFNMDTFVSKIPIIAEKNNNGLFSPIEIRKLLLNKIRTSYAQ